MYRRYLYDILRDRSNSNCTGKAKWMVYPSASSTALVVCSIVLSLLLVASPALADSIAAIGTIEAFRQQTGNPPIAYATGYSSVGDGGEGMLLRAPDSCVDDGLLHYQNREGVCYIRAETNGIINVKWAGARG